MEGKDILNLLDMLFGMIDEAKNAPFSADKCVINRDEALDLLEEIRGKLPDELAKAKNLMATKDEYIARAEKRVKNMLQQANQDAKVIISESEILQQAHQQAADIIRRAEDRSRELYQVANTYTEDALVRTEEAIQAALEEVKDSRVRFRAISVEMMQGQRDDVEEMPAEEPAEDEAVEN